MRKRLSECINGYALEFYGIRFDMLNERQSLFVINHIKGELEKVISHNKNTKGGDE